MSADPSSSPQGSPRPSIIQSADHAQMVQMQQQMQQMQHLIQQQQQQLQAASVQAASVQQSAPIIQRLPELPKIRQPSSFSGAMGFAVDDWISELHQQFAYYGHLFPEFRYTLT
jgi:TolA-binding protein